MVVCGCMKCGNYRLYSVEAVANCILKQGAEMGIELTNLKLQKLVYFVQGFSLALVDHPMFREDIYAWTYGPVIPSLYKKLKRYGAGVVNAHLEACDTLDGDAEAEGVVRVVMNTLGNMRAMALVSLSHRKYSPWYAAWREGRFTRIPLWNIAVYFKDLLAPVEENEVKAH